VYGEWASIGCVVFHSRSSFIRLCMRYCDEMKGRAGRSISVIDDGEEEYGSSGLPFNSGRSSRYVFMCV
jgi:hypothetical protein